MKDFMLTTIDNPFDPFTEFLQWWNFDNVHGYHTCEFLDRVSNVTNVFDDLDENSILSSMEEIVEFDSNGLYKIVFSESKNIDED